MKCRRSLTVALAVGLLVIALPLFAGGNKEQPRLDEFPTEASYLSPNGDGVQDTASLSFRVTLRVKSDEGYVPVYGLRIRSGDDIIRDVKKDTEKSDIGFFARIFRSFTEFTLKRDLDWDGKDDEGKVVADGTYVGQLYVIDASKNTTEIDVGEFVVDNVAPTATVSAASLYFSPNGDGSKDALELNQNGSPEDLWTGTVLDSGGRVTRTFTWRDGAPGKQSWDGRTDSGAAAADGKYDYLLAATDRAGNSVKVDSLKGIVLDTKPTPVAIKIDPAYISPNGDGVQDRTTFALTQDIKEGIVGWRGTIADSAGKVVMQMEERGATVPASVVFDGLGSDGRVLADGAYTVFYTVFYQNGNEPQTAETLNVDTRPPEVSLGVDNPVFSPVGRKDKVTVTLKSNETVTWKGRFLAPDGKTLTETSSAQTTTLVVWNGRDPASGRPLPEGVYSLDVTFTDLAGNSTRIPATPLEIDTTAPRVAVALDHNTFSPNGDGVRDTITATITPSEPVSGRLSARDARGAGIGPVVLPRVAGTVDQVWDGIGPTGQPLPDGRYEVSASFEDQAGNVTDVGPLAVTLDRRAGLITLRVPEGFSPNQDGTEDDFSVEIDAVAYDGLAAWTLVIQDSLRRAVRTFTGADSLPRQVAWDGKTDAGTMVAAEGEYTAAITASYRNGNEAAETSRQFLLDVSPPAVTLDVAPDPFVKAGERQLQGEAFVTLKVRDASPIRDWTLDILNQDGEVVRSYAGKGDPSDQVAWKGEIADGRRQATDYQGNPASYVENYSIRMGVADVRGNATVYRSPVPLDVLVLRKDGKLFLLVPNIIFGAYQHALDSRGEAIYRRNLESLRRVAALAKRYPAYGIGLEAHALNIYRGGTKDAAEEKVLGPLTERRAATVRRALIELGVASERVSSNAYGGRLPLVSVTDRTIYWKNRRVEFLLIEP